MQRQSVTSSNIGSVGYDERAEMLEIAFVSGSIYQYLHVPAKLYQQFFQAESKGGFFNAHIKKAFAYRKVA